jgi:1-acyl-sn-glycerol-3-phosphate acyltransferase
MSIKAQDKLTLDSQEPAQKIVLPPLTAETIQRAKEGLAAARELSASRLVYQALMSSEAIAEERSDNKISGEQRRIVLRSLIHTLFRVKVEYPERIPTTPALLAPNHLNHIDPFLLLSELPARPYYHILGDARTLYNKWWKRQLLRLAKGVIPLERLWSEELAVIEAAKQGVDELADLAAAIEHDVPHGGSIETLRRLDRIVQAMFARGDGILIFPEGGLGKVEGQLRPLKRGAVIYALRAGVPIVPVGIIGTQNLYFKKELTIRFGQPLIFPQSNRPKPREVQAVLDHLQAALITLLPQDYCEPDEVKLLSSFLNRMFW